MALLQLLHVNFWLVPVADTDSVVHWSPQASADVDTIVEVAVDPVVKADTEVDELVGLGPVLVAETDVDDVYGMDRASLLAGMASQLTTINWMDRSGG